MGGEESWWDSCAILLIFPLHVSVQGVAFEHKRKYIGISGSAEARNRGEVRKWGRCPAEGVVREGRNPGREGTGLRWDKVLPGGQPREQRCWSDAEKPSMGDQPGGVRGWGGRSQSTQYWDEGSTEMNGSWRLSQEGFLHRTMAWMVRGELPIAGQGEENRYSSWIHGGHTQESWGPGWSDTIRNLHHCCPYSILITLRREDEEEILNWGESFPHLLSLSLPPTLSLLLISPFLTLPSFYLLPATPSFPLKAWLQIEIGIRAQWVGRDRSRGIGTIPPGQKGQGHQAEPSAEATEAREEEQICWGNEGVGEVVGRKPQNQS